MTYFKSLIINFLTVFFVNHVIPDIQINSVSKLPHIGGDLIFAFSLGFIISLIFPFFIIFKIRPTHFKIGVATLILSVGSYLLLSFMPLGIKILSIGAYVWASLIVWFMAYTTSYLEIKSHLKQRLFDQNKSDNNNLDIK